MTRQTRCRLDGLSIHVHSFRHHHQCTAVTRQTRCRLDAVDGLSYIMSVQDSEHETKQAGLFQQIFGLGWIGLGHGRFFHVLILDIDMIHADSVIFMPIRCDLILQ